jgi:putative sigma-54 modulation protein
MRLNVKSKNGPVTDALRQYAEKKVKKLERYFRRIDTAELEQEIERGQHIVELSLEGDGVFLRSEERCNDIHAAIDNVVEKLESQVKRFKTKARRGHQRPGPVKEVGAELASSLESGETDESEEEGEGYRPRIVRRKRFPMKPMPAEEAARQMELLDHSFFLFMNVETGNVNVLYRRRDGDYGLIEPET